MGFQHLFGLRNVARRFPVKFSRRKRRPARRGGSRRRPAIEPLESRMMLSIGGLDEAADPGFVFGFGSSLSERGYAAATDDQGDVYVAGRFDDLTDFDPGSGSLELDTAGGSDAFVAKYTSAGHLVWARALGGPVAEEAKALAVDSAGNVYVAGWFQLTTDFDPGPGTAELTSEGSMDGFVVKLDSAGSLSVDTK